MKCIYNFFLISFLITDFVFAQYTLTGSSDNGLDWITRVAFEGINNDQSSSAAPSVPTINSENDALNNGKNNPSYGDFSSSIHTNSLTPGNSYTLTVEFYSDVDGADLGYYLQAWFDWNRDGDFNDSSPEEGPFNIGGAQPLREQNTSNSVHRIETASITIPNDFASSGQAYVRMRIILSSNTYPGSAPAVDGNTAPTYGEVEDYSLNPSLLPVELTSFTAHPAKNTVQLKWATATEVNNYGFDIERISPNPSPYQGGGGEAGGGRWTKIGFVNGHGNSNSPKEYSFADDSPLPGYSSYRLKQIDFDGAYEYSDAITVSLSASSQPELMQNNPNPFNPSTAIKFYIPENNIVSIKIYDMLGREITTLINKTAEAGYHIVYWNGKDENGREVSSGVYLYKLTAGNFSETKKMNLMK